MFLSRVQINPGPELFKLLKDGTSSNGYFVHQLLWGLFPNTGDKKRDFLFREDNEGGYPRYLVVSDENPVPSNAVSVHCKPYEPKVKKGDHLYFTLTANPVIARKIEGKKNSVKHDVWMDAKRTAKTSGLKMPELVLACESAVKNWLVNRAEQNGFLVNPNELLIDGYLQHRFSKKKSGKEITFSSVNYAGILQVNDPEVFVEKALYKGLGASKAFGCGLMLVRRA